MKKILEPTDFSECAEAASVAAMAIAVKAKSEIYFLHLHSPEPAGGHMAMHGSGTDAEHHHHDCAGPARAKLDELVKKMEHQGLSAKSVLVMDENREQIQKHISAFSIDFVVMGTHGSKGLKEVFLGTNADYLVKHSVVPALIIKKKREDFTPQKIVFASDFEVDNNHALEFVNFFASLWNSMVYLLFTNTSSNFKETDKVMENMKRCSRSLTVPTHVITFNAKNEQTGIHQYAGQISADVIIVPRSFKTRSIVPSSIAKMLVNSEDRPILVV